jgi:phage baseplate assembly protein W
MPIERISKEFVDVSLTIKVNPVNFDILILKNETAIARAIRNLVLTYPGERLFNANLGSRISRSLFENIDPISANSIKNEIEYTIRTYEPRVELTEVIVDPDYDANNFNVTIIYNIIGVDVPTQKLSFALQPTR